MDSQVFTEQKKTTIGRDVVKNGVLSAYRHYWQVLLLSGMSTDDAQKEVVKLTEEVRLIFEPKEKKGEINEKETPDGSSISKENISS